MSRGSGASKTPSSHHRGRSALEATPAPFPPNSTCRSRPLNGPPKSFYSRRVTVLDVLTQLPPTTPETECHLACLGHRAIGPLSIRPCWPYSMVREHLRY